MNPSHRRKSPAPSERSKQQLPADIVGDLMGAIRRQFYADSPQWFKDQSFIRVRVVLWPATWLDKRGVSLPPERFKAILFEVFNGIKAHGQTGTVKYWPGYLMSCVQKHYAVHGEEYYEEGKSLRASLDRALSLTGGLPRLDPIRVLAEARRDLVAAQKRKKKLPKTTPQLNLF